MTYRELELERRVAQLELQLVKLAELVEGALDFDDLQESLYRDWGCRG